MPNLYSPEDLATGYLIDDYYHNYLKFYQMRNTNLIQLQAGLKIRRAIDTDSLYFRLENNNNKHLSVIRLKEITLHNKLYYLVDKSHSFVKGQGYVIPLYEYAFCYLKYPVISDSNQTKPGSSNLWKKLQGRQAVNSYNLFVINTNTQHKGLYETRNYSDYDVWGWEREKIELYNINPDFISGIGEFEDNYNEDIIENDEVYYEEDEDDLFNEIPLIDPVFLKYLKRGKKKLKDRKHIRLVGQKKVN